MEGFLEELEEKKEKKRITVLVTLLAILLAILVTIIIFCTNQSTNGSSRKEATAIAKTSANLETVDKFYWFTRKNTYFTLTGKMIKAQRLS